MSKRLHTVEGPFGPVMARGWAADPETLEGLTGPIEHSFLLGLPRAMAPADLALVVAALALLTMGRDRCRLPVLARLCGLGPKSLKVALGRLARWVPSLPVRVEGDEAVFACTVKRRLRPDTFVRLKVEAVARAPSATHARVYALAAWAAAGNEAEARNLAEADLPSLDLARAADPGAALAEALAWAQPLFGDARQGRVLSGHIADGRAVVRAVNSCHWNYDHKAAPRPWIGKGKGYRKSIHDGVWQGHELSVPWLRVAKVCEWVRRDGCAMSADELVAGWLTVLRRALAGEECDNALSGRRLLDLVARTDAVDAFEKFVVDAGRRASLAGGRAPWPWLTPATRLSSDEARVLRRMAMRDPADPRLKVHARCGETGEVFTAMQFARLVRRTMAHLRASGASRVEISETWRRLHRNYRSAPAPQPTAVLPSLDANAVGAEIMISQCLAGDAERVAHEVALAAVLGAAAQRGASPEEAVDQAIAVLRWGDGADPANEDGRAETARWVGLRRDWTRASRAETLPAAARRIALEAVARASGTRQAA